MRRAPRYLTLIPKSQSCQQKLVRASRGGGVKSVMVAASDLEKMPSLRRHASNMPVSPAVSSEARGARLPPCKCHAYHITALALTGRPRMQRLYSPAAINVDFALITLKTPVTEGTGYFGITRGTGNANLDISSVRDLPVIYLHFPSSNYSVDLMPASSIYHARTYTHLLTYVMCLFQRQCACRWRGQRVTRLC